MSVDNLFFQSVLLNSFPVTRVRYFLYGLVVVISLFIIMKILQRKNHFSGRINLPPETWFYSKLIDIELGTEKEKNIISFFLKYISLKYGLKNINKSNFPEMIGNLETDIRLLGFLKGYYEELLELEKNKFDRTIEFIKETKFNFNQNDLSDWLKKYDLERKNNC